MLAMPRNMKIPLVATTTGQDNKAPGTYKTIMDDHPENRIHILCVGPKSAGKTMLMKRLQRVEGVDRTYSAVPTVGTDIYRVHYRSEAGKKLGMLVREVGGEMAPLWSSYLDNITKVIFVVDTSNLCQISAGAVLLYTLLAEPRLQRAKFLLVLAKMDAAYRQMRNEALLMLQFQRLSREVPQRIAVLETSAITGEGVGGLREWVTGVRIPDDTLLK